MKGLILLVFIFMVGMVSASSVTCTIVDEKVLVEVILSDGAGVILPEEYSLLESDGEKRSFISEDWIQKDGDWIFVLPRVVTGFYDLEVYLPKGYDLVYPKEYKISSDGTSIILNWEGLSDDEVIVFYEGTENSYFWFWFIILGLIVLGFGFWYFEKIRFAKRIEKMKKDIVKSKASKRDLVSLNLFGEEKSIVEFLMAKKGKSCWGKELVRELGISKVMASRKVRSLIEKGIIEKESFGRENKISLRK